MSRKGFLGSLGIGFGVLFLGAAIVMLVLSSAMLKIPADITTTGNFEGTAKIYVDPASGELLPAPVEVPLEVRRDLRGNAGESDSERVVMEETVTADLGPQSTTDKNAYVLDRKTSQGLKDDRSYAFSPQNVVDRSGTYVISLEFNVDKDKAYPAWKNEIGTSFDISKAEGDSETEIEGIKTYIFTGDTGEELPVAGYYREVLESRGFPAEIPFDAVKAQLKAVGVDVEQMIATLATVLNPEDMAALAQLTSEPVELDYLFYSSIEAAIEPKLGVIVSFLSNYERLSIAPSGEVLSSMQNILLGYASEPQVKAIMEEIAPKLAQFAGASQPVMEIEYCQTDASVAEGARDVKDALGVLGLMGKTLPAIFFVLAALLMSLGVGLLIMKSRKA